MTLEERISADIERYRRLRSSYGGNIPQTRFNKFLHELALEREEDYMNRLIAALYENFDLAKKLLKCSPSRYKLPEGAA